MKCLRCETELQKEKYNGIIEDIEFWIPHAYDVVLYRCPKCNKLEIYKKVDSSTQTVKPEED